jgi:membrane associated rhomboid family serine protease
MTRRPARSPLGRYPASAAVTALTAGVGGAQFLWPGVVGRLQRDRARLRDGEWWRLATPLLVQSDGLGQYAYNVAGSVLVGVAVESRNGHGRWLACYIVGGLAGNAAAYHWHPGATGAGSSDAVAGLIGALTVAELRDRALPPWPAYLYAIHFAAYLTVLDAAGFQAGALAGGAALVASAVARRRLPPERQSRATAAAVIAAAAVMTKLRDPHGVGLVTGLALAAIKPRTCAGRATR